MYDNIRVPPPPLVWDLTLSPLYRVKLSTLSSVIILMNPNIDKHVDPDQTVSMEVVRSTSTFVSCNLKWN